MPACLALSGKWAERNLEEETRVGGAAGLVQGCGVEGREAEGTWAQHSLGPGLCVREEGPPLVSEGQVLLPSMCLPSTVPSGQRPGQAEGSLPQLDPKAQQPFLRKRAPLIRWVNFKGANGEGVGRAADSRARVLPTTSPHFPPP